MDLQEFAIRAITVPFVVGGRDWSGWDCWGLVYRAYADVFGIAINRLDIEYDDKQMPYAEIDRMVNAEKSEWNAVLSPAPGDIGLYRIGRFQSHVSLILANRRMLHCERATGTISERVDSLVWGRRNVGYYQHA